MGLITKLSPKRFFGSKKDRSFVSRSEPSSFSSGTTSSSSSDSSSSNLKAGSATAATRPGTPTSVLPQISGDWSDISRDISADNTYVELVEAIKVNDGLVSRGQLEALLCRLGGEPPSEEEVSMMLSELDGDSDGCISLEALMRRAACEPACEVELRQTFDIFDTDHDGRITAEELLAFFTAIGDERCTLEDCQRMIANVDKNGDGFVCFEDFSRMMELQR